MIICVRREELLLMGFCLKNLTLRRHSTNHIRILRVMCMICKYVSMISCEQIVKTIKAIQKQYKIHIFYTSFQKRSNDQKRRILALLIDFALINLTFRRQSVNHGRNLGVMCQNSGTILAILMEKPSSYHLTSTSKKDNQNYIIDWQNKF